MSEQANGRKRRRYSNNIMILSKSGKGVIIKTGRRRFFCSRLAVAELLGGERDKVIIKPFSKRV
ncbi:MAG: hypothetical protein QXN34_06975 [Archaeoglobaceae archaeon]